MHKNIVTKARIADSIFFCCDVTTIATQPKYKNWNIESIVTIAKMMAKVTRIWQIPIVVTEYFPERFGPILNSIKEDLAYGADTLMSERDQASMIDDQTREFLKGYPDRKVAILYGVEAHVRVKMTCFDLLESGYEVHILTDGVGSVREGDRVVALKRMQQAGAFLDRAESIIFELLKRDPPMKELFEVFRMDRSGQMYGF